MIRKLTAVFAFVFLAFGLIASPAVAAVTFDSATGTGFVGKGDVQLALGMNNQQVQNFDPTFTYNSTVVTEVSWECANSNNDKVQVREQTTTSTITGVVDSTARVKNQVTGYNLTGFGPSTESSTTTDGPKLNSCPNANGNWSLTTEAGEPVEISRTGGLYVNGVPIG